MRAAQAFASLRSRLGRSITKYDEGPAPPRLRARPSQRAILFAGALALPAIAVPAAPAARSVLTVSAATVQRQPWPETLELAGPVAAWQEAIVSARAGGLPLVALLADIGSPVHRGEALARFDARSVKAEWLQAKASLEQAEASASQALANRKRGATLHEYGSISSQDMLKLDTDAETTRAQVTTARAALEAARIKLENTVVKAPDDGVISSRSALLGQTPGSGAELFRLIRQNRLVWRAEVPAQQLARIHPGQRVELRLADGGLATGRVRLIAPTLDETTRLGRVDADLDSGSLAKPSMYVTGRIILGEAPALCVPAESVVIRDGRAQLFAIENQRARRVPVTIGRSHGTQVEVSGALEAGQRVVLRGAGFLADGDRIDVVAEAAAAPVAARSGTPR